MAFRCVTPLLSLSLCCCLICESKLTMSSWFWRQTVLDLLFVVLHINSMSALDDKRKRSLSVPYRDGYVIKTHPLFIINSNNKGALKMQDSQTPLYLKDGRPSCARQLDYCVYSHEYPQERVDSIINRYYSEAMAVYSQLRFHLPQDLARFDNTSYESPHRKINGRFICQTEIRHLRIGWARNIHSLWMTIVNNDQFHQSVRLEHCRFSGRPCEYIPPCLNSVCMQRYAVTHLMAVDPSRPDLKPILDKFIFPSGCSCFVEDYMPPPV